VVEIVTAGVDDETGVPYIAMELLRGEELADTVDRRGPLPLGEVREVMAQVGHALEQAHALGIVHRDLKPENIFLSRPKRRDSPFTAKLLDFGVAKFLALGASEMGTTPVGSPLYMAPEQTDSFGNICPGTDIWALGLLAFYLLTGRSYWLGAEKASVPVLLKEVCLDPLVKASERAAELGVGHLLPIGFDEWFERCVVRETDERYAEAGVAVRAFLYAVPEAAPPSRFPAPLSMAPSEPYDPNAVARASPALALDEEDDALSIEVGSEPIGSVPERSEPSLDDGDGGLALEAEAAPREGSFWFPPPEPEARPDAPADEEPQHPPPPGGSFWFGAEADAASPAEPSGSLWFSAEPAVADVAEEPSSNAPETEPSATEASPGASSWASPAAAEHDLAPGESLWFSAPTDGARETSANDGASSLWFSSSAEEGRDLAPGESLWFNEPGGATEVAPANGESPWFASGTSPEGPPVAEDPKAERESPVPHAVDQRVPTTETSAAPRDRRARVAALLRTPRVRWIAAGVVGGTLVGALVGIATRGGASKPAHHEEPAHAPPVLAAPPRAAWTPCGPSRYWVKSESGSVCLDRTEVTVDAYEKCVARGDCEELEPIVDFPAVRAKERDADAIFCNRGKARARYPMNCIDWWSASTYCHAQNGRLASQAEHLAAEALVPKRPANDKRPWANVCGEECLDWNLTNGFLYDGQEGSWDEWQGTSPVGTFARISKAPIADLDGNVAEWTVDEAPREGDGRRRWVVGAAFMPLPYEGATRHLAVAPEARSHAIGLRCVVAPVPVDPAAARADEAEEGSAAEGPHAESGPEGAASADADELAPPSSSAHQEHPFAAPSSASEHEADARPVLSPSASPERGHPPEAASSEEPH
jgi:serine/threonine protein kinase